MLSASELTSSALAEEEGRVFSAIPTSKVLVRGRLKNKSCLTYAGWQGLIPSSPLPRQADQHPAASQGIARVTAKGHRAASKVSLVMDLVAELWDARVLAFNEFETWSGRNSICFHQVFNSHEILTQDHINICFLKSFAGEKKHHIEN